MLSNKWTFSLKVLVLLVTVGFIATPAMAGEFDVTLDTTGDVSSAGELQLMHPADGTLEVLLTSRRRLRRSRLLPRLTIWTAMCLASPLLRLHPRLPLRKRR